MKLAQILLGLALAAPTTTATAGGLHATDMSDAIKSAADSTKAATFDILAAHIHQEGRIATFHMTTTGQTGTSIPSAVGKLAGAPVFAYVWPTSLDPSTVGFEAGTGILALAATSHPDFDDTPLYDENNDHDTANDGARWHSHWVVLAPTEACGAGNLAVRDIPEGETPDMPLTWPGLPIFLDSPGYTPVLSETEISVAVPFANAVNLAGTSYDGVTAALRVNADLHTPLLCVTDVFDIASGDLSLPGLIKP